MDVTEDRAQSLIVGCLAGAAVISAGNAIAAGHAPEFRQVAGFTFVALGLGVGSMFAPGLAGGMAVLVLTSTALIYGGPIFDAVATVTGGVGTLTGVTGAATTKTKTTTIRKA